MADGNRRPILESPQRELVLRSKTASNSGRIQAAEGASTSLNYRSFYGAEVAQTDVPKLAAQIREVVTTAVRSGPSKPTSASSSWAG